MSHRRDSRRWRVEQHGHGFRRAEVVVQRRLEALRMGFAQSTGASPATPLSAV
jgi:hypothetical protein